MKKSSLYLLAIGLGCMGLSLYAFSSDTGEYFLRNKRDTIFSITPVDNNETGGTGFNVKSKGGRVYTITNAHVCAVSKNGLVAAHKNNGDIELIHILAESPDTDLCILEGVPNAPALEMASGVDIYHHLNVLGHPYLHPITYSDGYIVNREISKVWANFVELTDCIGPKYHVESIETWFGPRDICVLGVDSYSLSVRIYPGNSGSPVMNDDGEVVGVIFAGDEKTTYGDMIPLDALRKFVSTF